MIPDTRDVVEQLYGCDVNEHFPNYFSFWEKFIGDPKKDVPLPFGLIFPDRMREDEKREIRDIYNEICMAHYSIFCHLAGTHFQLEKLKKALGLSDFGKKYFRHWEAFEVCYFHLGSAFYQMYHLWGLLFLLKGEIQKDSEGRIRGSKKKLKQYLEAANQGYLCPKIDEFDEEIKTLRDNIVHFSREASEIHFGEFYIPFKSAKRTWKEQHQSKKWLETSKKIRKDLLDTEEFLNDIHRFLIEEFEGYLKTKHLRVKR